MGEAKSCETALHFVKDLSTNDEMHECHCAIPCEKCKCAEQNSQTWPKVKNFHVVDVCNPEVKGRIVFANNDSSVLSKGTL